MPETILQPAEVASALHDIKAEGLGPGSGGFVVDGTKLYNGWFLKTERLIFKSGGILSFSIQAQDKRNLFYVIAKEIVCEDSESPGTITWQPKPIGGAPAAGGQAPTGAHATVDDQGGGPGSNGAMGPQGYQGYSAPFITVVTLSVPGSGPIVDFRGQDGDPGGMGQRGGDGGNGAKGHPASSGAFDCKNGAGNGGPGGPGGAGGQGGPGGTGGHGGTVTLISTPVLLPGLTAKFRSLLSGGQGGSGGPGGPGGNGGLGGPRGAPALPWCKDDGSPGGNGAAGPGGPTGNAGLVGNAGDLLVGAVSEEQFSTVW